jgi:hypothetical protein
MNPSELTIEELALEYEKVDIGLKEFIAAKDVISEEIISRMKSNQELAGDIILNKCVRRTPDITLEWATEMGATKLAIDNDKIKELKKSGIKIPEKEGRPYLLISKVE